MAIYARWSGGGGGGGNNPDTPTGLTEVYHDNTLSGNGNDTPLSIVPRLYRNSGLALQETFAGAPQSVVVAEDTTNPIKRGEIILGSNGVWAVITSVAEADGGMVSLQYETFKPTPNLYKAITGDINTNQAFKEDFGDLDELVVSGKVEDIIRDLYRCAKHEAVFEIV
jgi:hypothetical protein